MALGCWESETDTDLINTVDVCYSPSSPPNKLIMSVMADYSILCQKSEKED
jgi:hypothetical protein